MLGAGRLAVVAVGAVLTWIVTPWAAMALHGTVDQRQRDAMRRLGGGAPGPMPAAWDTVPGPRPGVPAWESSSTKDASPRASR